MSDDAKAKPRRPALQGLDAKALLGAGLEAEKISDQKVPEPGSPSRLPGMLWVGVLFVFLVAVVVTMSKRQPSTWQELLLDVEPSSNRQRGEWLKTDLGLQSVSEDQAAIIVIPFKDLGASYELRLRFTRHSGDKSIALFFQTLQGFGTLEFDAWEQPGLSGVQMFDELDLRQGGAFSFPIKAGQSYEVRLKVRPEMVQVWQGDRLMQSYPLAGRHLAVTGPWAWPNEWERTGLALGAWHDKVTFQKLSWRRLEEL